MRPEDAIQDFRRGASFDYIRIQDERAPVRWLGYQWMLRDEGNCPPWVTEGVS